MIRFLCPKCGTRLKAADNAAGKRSRCSCGQSVAVPATVAAEAIDPEHVAAQALGIRASPPVTRPTRPIVANDEQLSPATLELLRSSAPRQPRSFGGLILVLLLLFVVAASVGGPVAYWQWKLTKANAGVEVTEADGKSIVNRVMDGWRLSVSPAGIVKDNPDVATLVDEAIERGLIVLRYEHGPTRAIPNGRECQLTIYFQTRGGVVEQRRSHLFAVTKRSDGRWMIFGREPGDDSAGLQ